MAKYKFIKLSDNSNEFDIATITHEFESIQLDEIVEQFHDFLKGVGFSPGDRLEIIRDKKKSDQ
jgi:hypothetical protein